MLKLSISVHLEWSFNPIKPSFLVNALNEKYYCQSIISAVMKAVQIKLYCLTKPCRVKNNNKMKANFMHLVFFQGM